MKTLTAILFLAIGLPVQAEWTLTGATFHSCYLGEAIRAGYCAVGGEYEVQPEFITEPKPRLPYNRIIELPSGEISIATEIEIERTYSKWGVERTKTTRYRFADTVAISGLVPEETVWDDNVWLVVDQYGREFEIQKNASPDGCTLWLRGEWRQIRPWARDPFTDATLRYTHTECQE